MRKIKYVLKLLGGLFSSNWTYFILLKTFHFLFSSDPDEWQPSRAFKLHSNNRDVENIRVKRETVSRRSQTVCSPPTALDVTQPASEEEKYNESSWIFSFILCGGFCYNPWEGASWRQTFPMTLVRILQLTKDQNKTTKYTGQNKDQHNMSVQKSERENPDETEQSSNPCLRQNRQGNKQEGREVPFLTKCSDLGFPSRKDDHLRPVAHDSICVAPIAADVHKYVL